MAEVWDEIELVEPYLETRLRVWTYAVLCETMGIEITLGHVQLAPAFEGRRIRLRGLL
jgi:hypothetical protein